MFVLPLPPFSRSPSFAYLMVAMFTQVVKGSEVLTALIAEASFFSGARLHSASRTSGINLTKHLVSC